MSESAKIGTPFTVTPVWIVESPTLSRDAKFLFSVLWRYSDNSTRQCCVARATLAEACNVKSLRTIDTWIAALVNIGAVEKVTGGGRKSSIYKLKTSQDCTSANGCTRAVDCTAPLQEFAPHPCTELQGTRAASCAAPVQPAAPVLETAKKLQRNSERETARPSALIDLTSFKVVPESTDNASEAFDAGEFDFADENEQRRKMARALCEAFAANTKSHGRQWYWKNPPLTRLDRIVTALQSWPIPPGDPFKHYDRLIKFCLGHKWWHDKLQTPEKLLAKFDEVLADFETAVNAGEVEYAS